MVSVTVPPGFLAIRVTEVVTRVSTDRHALAPLEAPRAWSDAAVMPAKHSAATAAPAACRTGCPCATGCASMVPKPADRPSSVGAPQRQPATLQPPADIEDVSDVLASLQALRRASTSETVDSGYSEK